MSRSTKRAPAPDTAASTAEPAVPLVSVVVPCFNQAQFLAAIAKQRRVYAAGPSIGQLLRQKDRITRDFYRSVSPWRRLGRVIVGTLPTDIRTPAPSLRQRSRPAS